MFGESLAKIKRGKSNQCDVMAINPINNANTLYTQNIIGKNNEQLNKIFERLSSAQRINQASDDAAGLAIAERMLAQLNALNMAERNTMDGRSVSQLADAYSSGIGSDLQRMRELAVQSSNGTLTDSDRAALNEEFTALQENISSTISSADFNGTPLLSQDGSINIQAGANEGDTIGIPTTDLGANSTTGIGAYLDSATFNISSAANAQAALSGLDEAISRVDSNRATIGATANRLDFAANGIQDVALAQAQSRGRIVDADYARETSSLASLQIRQQSAIGLLGHASNMNAGLVSKLLGG